MRFLGNARQGSNAVIGTVLIVFLAGIGSLEGAFCLDPVSANDPYEGWTRDFRLPGPEPGAVMECSSLWATWYYLPQVSNTQYGYPLRDPNGNPLGPVLSNRDWCYAAMEGSVRVQRGASITTYNYAGTSRSHHVNCSPYFRHNIGYNKFRIAKGPFGDGVRDYILVPFRTIAVDPDHIPYGSVLFIAEARGQIIPLQHGRTAKHDGYFFAGDTGRAIRGNHIDVYLGTETRNPFPWVKSSGSGTFEGCRIVDENIRSTLLRLHQLP
jgi:3D (Asp-Asp-Asp) domain-containing protein